MSNGIKRVLLAVLLAFSVVPQETKTADAVASNMFTSDNMAAAGVLACMIVGFGAYAWMLSDIRKHEKLAAERAQKQMWGDLQPARHIARLMHCVGNAAKEGPQKEIGADIWQQFQSECIEQTSVAFGFSTIYLPAEFTVNMKAIADLYQQSRVQHLCDADLARLHAFMKRNEKMLVDEIYPHIARSNYVQKFLPLRYREKLREKCYSYGCI